MDALPRYSDRQDQFYKALIIWGQPFVFLQLFAIDKQKVKAYMFTRGVTAPESVHRQTFAHTHRTRNPDVFITCPMRQLCLLGASSNYSQSGGDLWSSRLPLYMSVSAKGQHRNEKWLQEHI